MSSTLREVGSGPMHELYEGERCVMRVDWNEANAVFRATYAGFIEGPCAKVLIKRLEHFAHQKRPVLALHDAWLATGYEGELRTLLVAWANAHPGAISAVHVLSQSSLVRMIVGVANLVIPGSIMKGYSKRAEFDALVQRSGLPLEATLPSLKPAA